MQAAGRSERALPYQTSVLQLRRLRLCAAGQNPPRVNMAKLIHVGSGAIFCLPGPVGEVGTGGQGVRVLGAQDPLADGQQRGVLVAGGGAEPIGVTPIAE